MRQLIFHSAEEMYNYCVKNGFGSGSSRSWSVKHCDLVLQELKPNEKVYCVFIGANGYDSTELTFSVKNNKNYSNTATPMGTFAYAITNQRIIMASKKLFGEVIQSVKLENVNDITYKRVLGAGAIYIDTIKETITISIGGKDVRNLFAIIHDTVFAIKSSHRRFTSPENRRIQGKSAVAELKEYKELLDLGIITEQEFLRKKRELLN